ncbi:L-seryl-tRNA(Sec) selenium transferase [Nocardioides campestrisoli]|uniref:L-seryl-tRNA(Sec) selenium transferase n=1 Tax=Nocardioides campestrisoli TaxID=2736757 RepID=UPI001CD41AD0|nr:L-seryl-tRNA(Sec) selenium transferase [Nocardioides campestrisoli]
MLETPADQPLADSRRAVPRTDTVLAEPAVRAATERLGATIVKDAVRRAQDRCRRGELAPDEVPSAALASLPPTATALRRVLNATGVVVHTNLGRAPLSPAAVEALGVAAGATDVELDLATGRRGRRGRSALAALAAAVPDAGGVHVVNNGAAALALVTAALTGTGRGPRDEVVIARGELVEIGDGFRIPELLESVGARLREVGTTNRVHAEDYRAALGERTAFVLKVHPSNFLVSGFTSSVELPVLARLAGEHGVPLVADIGSGLLAPHHRLPDEPSAAHALRAGADLVTASGDKLLGGPQCGLMLGAAELVERLRRHPFARALRVDKLTLAALEATLTGPESPVARSLAADPRALRTRAERIRDRLADVVEVSAVETVAAVGGGGAPEVPLASAAVSLPVVLHAPLRADAVLPVVGRVERGALLLDLVAVAEADDDALVDAVRRALAGGAG